MAVDLHDTATVTEHAASPAMRRNEKARSDPRFTRAETLFFGIGAQKSGTTWLHSYLASHPETHVPTYYKELDYWSSENPDQLASTLKTLNSLRPKLPLRFLAGAGKKPLFLKEFIARLDRVRFYQKWERCLSFSSQAHTHYADALFHGIRNQACAGEISPSYALCEPETFAEMNAMSKNVRFIFLMRDPVSRMWSGCRHELRTVLGGVGTTTDTVVDRLRSGLADAEDLAFKQSRYDQTISTLESVVPQNRIAYFFYETLFQQSEIDRLCDFLGIARRQADFDRRVNVKDDKSGAMPPEVARQAREALAPTYDFCKAKFGTLPPEWQEGPTGRET